MAAIWRQGLSYLVLDMRRPTKYGQSWSEPLTSPSDKPTYGLQPQMTLERLV
jgi:hypothetical protein